MTVCIRVVDLLIVALHKNSSTYSANTFLLYCLTDNSLAKNGEMFLQYDYNEDFFDVEKK